MDQLYVRKLLEEQDMPDNKTPQQKKALYKRSLIRRHHRIVFTAVMTLIVLLFLANLLTPSKKTSDAENRSLAQRPRITAGGLRDGSFAEDFDTYYSDQFVFRNQFIKLKFIGNMLLHIKENNGVLIGKEKYQFEIPAVPDEKLEAKTIQSINEYAKVSEGIETRMMIVPGSAAILKDKLPVSASVPDQVKDIKDFYSQIDDGIRKIDTVRILKQADSDNLYYKTDHHWTSEGAYTVFKAAAHELGIKKPGRYNKYTVSTSFKGSLSSKSGDFIGKDTIEVYVPKSNETDYYVSYPNAQEKRASIYKPEMLDVKDQYLVFFGGNHPLVEINTTAGTGRNLLILKDSYANAFVQFLIPYYDHIIMVDPRYYYDNVNMVVSNYGINEILYLYSADTLFTDTSLSDALEAAADAAAEDQDQSEEAQGEETQKE